MNEEGEIVEKTGTGNTVPEVANPCTIVVDHSFLGWNLFWNDS